MILLDNKWWDPHWKCLLWLRVKPFTCVHSAGCEMPFFIISKRSSPEIKSLVTWGDTSRFSFYLKQAVCATDSMIPAKSPLFHKRGIWLLAEKWSRFVTGGARWRQPGLLPGSLLPDGCSPGPRKKKKKRSNSQFGLEDVENRTTRGWRSDGTH